MNEQNFEIIDFPSGVIGAVESRIGGRSENQDSYLAVNTPLGPFVIVCDGMGGGPAGKTASSMAADTMARVVMEASLDDDVAEVLALSAIEANRVLLAASAENPALRGMGTTCVAVLIHAGKAYIVHVGDSRCYLLRGSKVRFRTLDHSYVGELVRRGTISEEQARNSNYSNIITRAIGGDGSVDPEVDVVDIRPSDRFALMTDGVWGAFPEESLVSWLSDGVPPSDAVARLADKVDQEGRSKGGGHDNLTLAIIDLPPVESLRNDNDSASDEGNASGRFISPEDVAASESDNVGGGWSLSDSEDPEGGYIIDDGDDDKTSRRRRPVTIADKLAIQQNSQPRKDNLTRVEDDGMDISDKSKIDYKVPKGSRTKTMFLVLSLIILGAVAFVAWQYFSKEDSEKIIATAANVAGSENGALSKSKDHQNLTPGEDLVADRGDKSRSDIMKSQLKEAEQLLNELAAPYSDKFSKKNNKDKFEKRLRDREAKLARVKKILENYRNSVHDSDVKNQISSLINEIGNAPVRLDSNQAQPTAEAIREINRLIDKITKF